MIRGSIKTDSRETVVRSVLVGSQKGGVGKTSVVAALGALAARPQPGRRVLLIDGDQQSNLSKRNFGLTGDGGRGLYSTIVLGEPLQPTRDVRPGLDVVPGGPALAMVAGAAANAAAAGLDMAGHLRSALEHVNSSGDYALALIDLGPGDVALLDAVLAAVDYVVAPHREDEADLDGVELLIKRILRARRDANPTLAFLGTIAFARDPRATARNGSLQAAIRQLLSGSGVEPFEATIRHSPAVARDARALALTPQELIAEAERATSARISMLRLRRAGEQPGESRRLLRPRSRDDGSLWARPEASEALARDYLDVLRELFSRIASAEQGKSSPAEVSAG
jgi:chromosome partitioning protein